MDEENKSKNKKQKITIKATTQASSKLLLTKEYIVEQKQKGVTVEDLERQIEKASMESQSTFTFYPHGVGIRETPGDDPVKGSWKLKKFGKLLIYTEMGSTQSIRLDIDTLTMTKMMVHTANLPKGMILTYIKQ